MNDYELSYRATARLTVRRSLWQPDDHLARRELAYVNNQKCWAKGKKSIATATCSRMPL